MTTPFLKVVDDVGAGGGTGPKIEAFWEFEEAGWSGRHIGKMAGEALSGFDLKGLAKTWVAAFGISVPMAKGSRLSAVTNIAARTRRGLLVMEYFPDGVTSEGL